jgi:colanic acid/amylovoran biosynthesis glycosyltransferase
VGQGSLEKLLKKQVRDAGLEGKVFIVGPRTESEIADLLGGTSIFVLACKTATDGGMDNLPTVIMEAMSASVPVVSTHVAGIPEMVVHGETGYLVTEGDCDALASAIRTLLEDPTAAEKIGERGRALAQEKFDISVTVGSLRSLLTHYGALRCTL